MTDREELAKLIDQVAIDYAHGKSDRSPGSEGLADAILESEWLNDVRGAAWTDGHAQGYDKGWHDRTEDFKSGVSDFVAGSWR